MIQYVHKAGLNGYIIGVIGKSINLNDRHLPDGICGIRIYSPAILLVICVAIVVIHSLLFRNDASGTILYSDHDGAGITVGQGDDIKACAGEGEACFRRIAIGTCCGIHCNLMRRAQAVCGKVPIVAVVAVEVIRVNLAQAGAAGAVLILHRSLLLFSVYGPYTGCITLGSVRRIFEGDEAILIVNGGCRDHGYGSVIIATILTAGVVYSIGELVHALHLHIGRGVTYHTLFGHGRIRDYRCLAVLAGKLGGCKRRICIAVYSSVCLFCTHILKFTLVIEHIVLQHMDIHRQTVVDDNRIGNGLDGIGHSEPDHRMSIIITSILCAQFCGRIAAVLCDIGSCRILALCDGPAAGAVGVDSNIVSGAGIVERIARGQNTGCNNIGLHILLAVQEHLAVNNRVGDGNLIGKGTGGAGGLVYDDLAVFIYQIEGVAHIGALPGKHGGYGVLLGSIAQPVGVVQCGAIVGGIGAGFSCAFHGASQIDIVAQCQLCLVDGAHLPVEGLRSQIIIVGSVSIGIDGNRLAGGVVPEGIGTDHAVNENIADLLIGVGLGSICVKCHRLQHCGSALPLADFGFRNAVRLCIDVIGLYNDLRRNGVCCSVTQLISGRSHLQIIAGAHGIHEAGIGRRIGNLIADGGKGIAQIICSVDLVIEL